MKTCFRNVKIGQLIHRDNLMDVHYDAWENNQGS